MFRIFKSRRPGPTDLTWEEKNSADYLYHSKDTTKSKKFINQEKKPEEKFQKIEDHSKIKEIREFVLRLESTKDKDVKCRLHHAATGLSTEAGEILSEVKKLVYYHAPLDSEVKSRLVDELADNLHYLVMATNILGTTFDHLVDVNIAKLTARYPNGYTDDKALNRSRESEKRAVEGIE